MEITEQSLRERYESLETGQLIELQTRGALTETAARVLEQVLAERAVSTQERVAVAAEIKERVAHQAAMMAALASRSSRLVAKVIDLVVTVVLGLLAIWLAVGVEVLGAVAFMLVVAYMVLADGLPGGQSFGKRLAGIVVVDRYTKRPCSYAESLVRNITLLLLGPIDWLFIFSPTRQRLGDVIVSTVVVREKHREIAGLDW